MVMTPDQKLDKMFSSWLNPAGVTFSSDKTKKQFQDNVQLLIDAIQLKVPKRIPVYFSSGFLPAYQAGITTQELMYDLDKMKKAWINHVFDTKPDIYGGSSAGGPGKPFETLEYKLYSWPGHGTPPNAPFQCNEAEYMKADEYDALIDDPSDFFYRTYMPRIFGSLLPFTKLSRAELTMELPFTVSYLANIGIPDVNAAMSSLMKAGQEAFQWRAAVGEADKTIMEAGFPILSGGSTKAPFDILADTLRGTRGIMLDIFRQPKKVIEAMERLVPVMIKMGVGGTAATGRPLVMIPLHKGADGFMSEEQYKKFYWPTFREVIVGLINEGVVPYLFAEGAYGSRLHIIKDIPRGKTLWHFDYTDMFKAKDALRDVACIAGNVPQSLLATSTADAVKEYCKKLIDYAGKDGGFMMAPGAVLDKVIIDNVKAMVEFTRQYGVYKS
jgi:hypothetical protein